MTNKYREMLKDLKELDENDKTRIAYHLIHELKDMYIHQQNVEQDIRVLENTIQEIIKNEKANKQTIFCCEY